MSITKHIKDGKPYYVVCEYIGYSFTGKRERKTLKCRTLAAAKLEQARLITIREAMSGRSVSLTLHDYIEFFYLDTMETLAASSRDTYKRDINKHILPELGSLKLSQITRQRVQKMLNNCTSYDVAHKALNTLKTILNQAKADQFVMHNVAIGKYKMPPKGNARDNGLVITTFQAMRPIVAGVKDTGDVRLIKLVLVGLYLGLRPEERYGLDWPSFDFKARTVHITQAYTQVSKAEGSNVLKKPKTRGSIRELPLSDFLYNELIAIYNAEKPKKSTPFIAGKTTERISPSAARKLWNRFLREHPELPRVTLENMRHSFATSYLAAGGSVETLSKFLGHSDINTTYRRYIRPDIGSMKTDLQKIEQEF